ncbi:MAG: hypothetical protein JWL59_3950 [Chthoniobacteraceae bacterium]|nr:hypothetical protein [Chthoniobacteraceae bacterium]
MKLWELIPRQPFTGLAIPAVTGVVAADWVEFPLPVVLAVTALTAVWAAARLKTIPCWAFVFTAFFALHTVRHHGSGARALSREFNDGARVVRVAGIVWSDPEPPLMPSRTIRARFTLKIQTIGFEDGSVWPGGALVHVAWAGVMPVLYGDRVELTGSGQNIAPIRNPGQFDFTAYLQRNGIYSEIQSRFASDCRITGHEFGNPAQAFAIRSSRWIKEQLDRDLEDSPEIAALIESMVLGLHGETPEEIKALFQRTGTMHLFAVSGLNVAMLASMIWFVLKPLRIPRGVAIVIILPILIAYALVTGLSASCVRATIMGALVLAAYLVDRRPILYNSLAASAFLILAWDTNQLFSPGFQFSFVLVFTIVWLALKIQHRIEPLGMPDPFLPRQLWTRMQKTRVFIWNAFASTLGVTLSAWCGSLLFTAGYFHLFSVASIFANLIAVPIAFVVLGLGLLSVVSAGISTGTAILFNNANWAAARLLLMVVKGFALVPGGHLYVEMPHLARPPPCEMLVFELGAGGAIHVRSAGRDWLIDCGSAQRYGQAVRPYLRSRGVNRLDGILLTHGDIQHIGGGLTLLDDFRPREIVESSLPDRSRTRRDFHAELAKRALGKEFLQRGDRIALSSETNLRVLFPPPDLKRSAADDKALVILIEFAGIRILCMSDSGFRTEQWLLENEPHLRADVLIKGQHERDFSGTEEFLQAVQPQALISSPPPFGQAATVSAKWQAMAAARGIAVFAQEKTGAVHIALQEAGMFELRGFANGQIFRSRAR